MELQALDSRYAPLHGGVAPGFESVARCFAEQFKRGAQIGAGFVVYRRGRLVVDLWGGLADVAGKRPWQRDTRLVGFSTTKGLAAMAFHLLADRGLLDWHAPVATYWPGFGRAGKEAMTVSTLLTHRGGLDRLDTRFTLADCTDPKRAGAILEALESQRPAWSPGTDQGYHAITFGMYARELFERIAGEDLGTFLRRELLEPLGSDVYLGTPPSEEGKFATLYPPKAVSRIANLASRAVTEPQSMEARVFRDFLSPRSTGRPAFLNPSTPGNDMRAYNAPAVTRHVLAWASATASADGLARAYLPFASRGSFGGRAYVSAETLKTAYRRVGWSDRDRVLQKPLGWSGGFVKEERHIFSPNPESFGHPGMGGALGWADPVEEMTIGYIMNRMDWRVRSARILELCRALYDAPAMTEPRSI